MFGARCIFEFSNLNTWLNGKSGAIISNPIYAYAMRIISIGKILPGLNSLFILIHCYAIKCDPIVVGPTNLCSNCTLLHITDFLLSTNILIILDWIREKMLYTFCYGNETLHNVCLKYSNISWNAELFSDNDLIWMLCGSMWFKSKLIIHHLILNIIIII